MVVEVSQKLLMSGHNKMRRGQFCVTPFLKKFHGISGSEKICPGIAPTDWLGASTDSSFGDFQEWNNKIADILNKALNKLFQQKQVPS